MRLRHTGVQDFLNKSFPIHSGARISRSRFIVKRHRDSECNHNGDMGLLKDRLRARRAELGLTQTELAVKARLKNQSIIGSLETGHRKSSTHIPAIADALGVYATWLATGKGNKELGSVIIPSPPIPLEEQAARVLAEMPDYLAEAWFSRVKGRADTLRAEQRAAQEVRQQQESDREKAKAHDPPIDKRRTA